MRKKTTTRTLVLLAIAFSLGCKPWRFATPPPASAPCFNTTATDIEYPDVAAPINCDPLAEGPPRTFRDTETEYWDLSLQEALHLALASSNVLRDLGGTVIRAPEAIGTPNDPAIQETDPLFGVPAVLSAFDADLATSLLGEKNDRRLNNEFVGDQGLFEQDYGTLTTSITKRAVTGTRFTARNINEYNRDNSFGNTYTNGAWTTMYEAEARHPFLRGAGMQFNRIAGPDAAPGSINGVVIARIRTDITLARFESQVRNFLSDVENSYWDLYFAYRDLDAKTRARNAALDTWRQIQARFETGEKGGEAYREAQAREQLLRFEEEVQIALVGRLQERTTTFNGSPPGTFQALPGVHVAERRLRLLVGLPANGTRLIRPSDEPRDVPIVFDWGAASGEALAQRVELRQQRWQVKRREMELLASKNFLLPNLDFVGRYRWRGFGDDLIDDDRHEPQFNNAYMDLTSGNFQEWQAGLEFSMPIGFRQGHVSVRNAELQLAREHAVLHEQERQVVYDLSNAIADSARAFAVLQIGFNRVRAAEAEVREVADAYRRAETDLFVLLDAQRRLAEAESNYFRTRVEYMLAVRNVQFEKGSLLDYCGVCLAEGPWPHKAYYDAAEREKRRGKSHTPQMSPNNPPVVSAGSGRVASVGSPELRGATR